MAFALVQCLRPLSGIAIVVALASCATYPDQLEQQINQYKQLPGPNKAFAVGFFPDGKWTAGWSYSQQSLEQAKAVAVQGCEEKGALTGRYLSCRLMYENLTFIKSPAPAVAVAPAAAAVASVSAPIAPAIGPPKVVPTPPAPIPVAAPVTAPTPEPAYLPAGSGVFISSDGLVLTAEHVINGARAIDVMTRDGRRVPAKVVAISRNMDLALLSANLSTPANFPVRLNRPNPGEKVFTVGYPATGILGSEVKVSDGIVNSASGIMGEAGLMQMSIPIQPGNSGGPVITEDGQLVGVVTSTAAAGAFLKRVGTLPQNVNWAVHSSLAVALTGKEGAAAPKLTRDKAIERAIQASVLVLVRN